MLKKRCAIYTRKSSEEGLEQDFNSLDAQREACAAFIKSQVHEGWVQISESYDDGGISGGTMVRPALQRLLADIEKGLVDIVVVYKVDRLTRSLSDFARIVEIFDRKGVSFVSVTQQFNTTSSMGRLTLNVLLSFAQFEREVTGERIRDKFAASRRKGIFMGGNIPIGYDLDGRRLIVNAEDAELVRNLYRRYLEVGNVTALKAELDQNGIRTRVRTSQSGRMTGGVSFSRGNLYHILKNRTYLGEALHKGKSYPGEHQAIVDTAIFDQVQERIALNRHDSILKTRSRERSLLTGLIYDQYGRRLSPRHTQKSGPRYRYYVSGAAYPTSIDGRAPLPIRVAAGIIEQLILDDIIGLLSSIGNMAALLDIPESALVGTREKALELVNIIQARSTCLTPALSSFVQRIVIGEQKISISISRAGLAQVIGAPVDSISPAGAGVSVRIIKAAFRRVGNEIKAIVEDDGTRRLQPRHDTTLIKAVVRAHAWLEMLQKDKSGSVSSIAASERLSRGYVRDVIRLGFLAPDIVDAILEGRQPAQLMLKDLMKGIPASWMEQRHRFGFPPILDNADASRRSHPQPEKHSVARRLSSG